MATMRTSSMLSTRKVSVALYDMDENHDIAIRYLRSSSSCADTDSVLAGGT